MVKGSQYNNGKGFKHNKVIMGLIASITLLLKVARCTQTIMHDILGQNTS